MSPLDFFGWLADSPWSVELHESQYAYSIIESLHVWALAVFFGSVVMFDLRLMGLVLRKVPASEVVGRTLPLAIAAFIVMVISGSLLFYAIPLRSYQNIFFRTKMLLLLLAGLNVWLFHSRIYPRVVTWDLDAVPPRAARVAGTVSLVLWIGIMFSGRMIAYNWFDCDMQPQPRLVNTLAGCVPGQAR